jgi:hypothetical protein
MGALAYYAIIIQCIVVSDGGIIPLYNIAGIILQLYIQTNMLVTCYISKQNDEKCCVTLLCLVPKYN